MRKFVIPVDNFNLVRLGKKRALAIPSGWRHPYIGPIVLMNAGNSKMQIEAEAYRWVYTTVRQLTTEDAVAEGFLNLSQLLDDLRCADPKLTLDTTVVIYYFRRTDREEG